MTTLTVTSLKPAEDEMITSVRLLNLKASACRLDKDTIGQRHVVLLPGDGRSRVARHFSIDSKRNVGLDLERLFDGAVQVDFGGDHDDLRFVRIEERDSFRLGCVVKRNDSA